MKKKPGTEIDPRDPNRDFWLWLLTGSRQEAETRAKHSKAARRRDDEYWANHNVAMRAAFRRTREAWLTDQEILLTGDLPED